MGAVPVGEQRLAGPLPHVCGQFTNLEELHVGGMAALMQLLALTHAGITTDEFDAARRG
jgi:hypothetical protein